MVTDERKTQLNDRLQKIGIDRLLADETSTFINTVGGPPADRIYAGEWLSRALAKRENTRNMRVEGKKIIRRNVVNELYDVLDGKMNCAIYWTNLAEHMNLENEVVGDALDYLEGEGLVDQVAIGSYGLTHKGVKEIEQWREHPQRETTHFPAFQVINNFGGTQVVAQGQDISVSHLSTQAAPPELQSLIERLTSADGGVLSSESACLIKATDSGSKLKIAAAAEDVAAKGKEHRSILATFKDELSKKVAEKTIDGVVHGAGWLCQHGSTVAAALALWHKN